ncbi:hypothetical protein EIP91_010082 [Steccherinum ochraceum]|uniref:Uncharacterized protein n=1 Tax=Steccherinum ochraceum TaxID=92696 RepID=A0A4R0RTU3_9APHY|nr:hypothetical protein EIP91_010082 [Steccherinum ochraceum]
MATAYIVSSNASALSGGIARKKKRSKLLEMRARQAAEAKEREEEERARREAEDITAHIEDVSLEDEFLSPLLSSTSKLDNVFDTPCPTALVQQPSLQSLLSTLSPPLVPCTLDSSPPEDITFRAATPEPPSPPPPFRTVRADLLQQIHLDVMTGGSFSDANIHLYSRRSRTGAPYAPRVLALNRRILGAASPEFEDYVFAEGTPIEVDDYLDDSDLEDEAEDDADLPALTMASLPDSSFDYQEPQTPTEEDITTRLGDADLMTDDEDDHIPQMSGMSTPARRSATRQSSPDEPRILDGAYKTWQAMSLYLYSDHIKFNPLRSHKPVTPPSLKPKSDTRSRQSPCSPKSMYRLAKRLRLEELREQAQAALESNLTEENIVDELFSDFTWRYPEILQIQTEIFSRHSTHPSVTTAMRRTFARIAQGKLPHSDVVLDSLFGKLTQPDRRESGSA